MYVVNDVDCALCGTQFFTSEDELWCASCWEERLRATFSITPPSDEDDGLDWDAEAGVTYALELLHAEDDWDPEEDLLYSAAEAFRHASGS